jgi:hypothetical protein
LEKEAKTVKAFAVTNVAVGTASTPGAVEVEEG